MPTSKISAKTLAQKYNKLRILNAMYMKKLGKKTIKSFFAPVETGSDGPFHGEQSTSKTYLLRDIHRKPHGEYLKSLVRLHTPSLHR